MVTTQSELGERGPDVRAKAGGQRGWGSAWAQGVGAQGSFGENIRLVQVLYGECDDICVPS